MLSNRLETAMIGTALQKAKDKIENLPPDFCHFKWDESRIDAAKKCIKLSQVLIDDDKDIADILSVFADLAESMLTVKQTY